MADGSIRIETKLDNQQIAKDLDEFSSMTKRTMNNIKRIFSGKNTFDNLQKDIKETEKLIKDSEKEIEIYKKRLDSIDSEKNVKEVQDLINLNNKQLEQGKKKLEEYQKKLDSIDTEKTVVAAQNRTAKVDKTIEKIKKKIDELNLKMEELETTRSSMEIKALDDARIGGAPGTSLDDSPKNLKRRADNALANDKDYQKIIDAEIKMSEKMDAYRIKLQEAESELTELSIKEEQLKSSLKEDYSQSINEYTQNIKQAEIEAETLAKTLESVKASTSEELLAGIDNSNERIEKANSKLNSLKSTLDSLATKVKKVKTETDNASKSSKSFGTNVANSVEKGIKKLAKMSLAIFSVRSAYNLVKKAADQYLSTNEQLSNQIQAIWNTLAQAIGPVVEKIVGWLVTLVSYINAFIKSLTGIDLVAKANAAALKSQASATKDVAKATKDANRQLASFDEMNVLQSNTSSDSSGGGSSGVSVPTLQLDDIDVSGLKEKFEKMLEPLKNAWSKYGKEFTDSFKYALNEIWELIKAIGKSFKEVWLNGTGELTCSLILQILTNIFNMIGNIARQFRIAWEDAGIGTQIIQNLWDSFNILLDCVNDVTKSLASWTGTIDFKPILNSVEKLTSNLKPLAELISGNILWAFENVLEPLGSWTIESALPASLNLFSSALDLLCSAAEALVEPAHNIWDNFLEPIASWTGGIIVDVLESVADALTDISNWIDNNQDLFTVLVVIIGSLATGFALVNVAVGVFTGAVSLATTAVGAFSSIMAFLTSPIALVAAAIAGIIAIISLLIIYWDDVSAAATDCWDWICKKWNEAVGFFQGVLNGIQAVFSGIGQWFKDNFGNAYNLACQAFNGIGKWFTDRKNDVVNVFTSIPAWFSTKFNEAWTNIKNIFSLANIKKFFGDVLSNIQSVFSSIPSWFQSKFSDAWQKVKNVFSSGGQIFDGIKDGILSGLKSVINALITGINKVIAVPFNGLNSALSKIKSISILGIKPFSWISTLSVPQIPKLAKGGIVNNPGPGVNMGDYIAGERGAEAIVPLENSEFIKSFAKEVAMEVAALLNEMNVPVQIVLQVGDKEFYKWFINLKRKYEFVTNGG